MNEKTYQEQEQEFLKELLQDKRLETFDVREHVLAQVKESFANDASIYDSYDNLLIKIAIGKKWASKFPYDYDAAFISNLVYQTAFLSSGVIKPRGRSKYEYEIDCGGHCFRGDTMNSWKTTLIEYFRLFGDRYLRYLEKNEDNRWGNQGKWRVPKLCPEELGRPWEKAEWEDFLSIPEVYVGEPLPSYITKFLENVYTIGNFIPVPQTPNFNKRRNGLCRDYWDLTLLAIYQYYNENKGLSAGWKKLFAQPPIKQWLDDFFNDSWDSFVDQNFLQDFVKRSPDGKYGPPKELWNGHFNGPILPEEGQFQEFFTNAAAWISARGTRIAIAVEDKLSQRTRG